MANQEEITQYNILQSLENGEQTSQRQLSSQLGINVASINFALKKLTKRGLVKMLGVNPRRIRYILTPKGITEKTQLAYKFFDRNFHFYKAVRKDVENKIDSIPFNGKNSVGLIDALKLKGHTPTQALQKAVRYVMGTPSSRQQADATSVQPRVSKEQVEEIAEQADKAVQRKTAAVKRNAEVAGKQPPSLNKAGENHDAAGGTLDAKKVAQMPYEDFVKLDDKTLARMRGDEFAGA